MAKEKNGFLIYRNVAESLLKLTPDDLRLKFYDALFRYGTLEQEAEFSGLELSLWEQFKFAIDNAKSNYKKTCENGSKGGRPSKFTESQEQEILQALENGCNVSEVALMYQCDENTIYRIIGKHKQ